MVGRGASRTSWPTNGGGHARVAADRQRPRRENLGRIDGGRRGHVHDGEVTRLGVRAGGWALAYRAGRQEA